MIPCLTTVDRFNRDIVEIALSLEEGEVVDLHSFMTRAFPHRKVSDRYKHGNYHTNAEAIVLSSWSNRKAYIMCGAPGYAGVPSCCHQTLVCEACCKKAAARMYVRYQHAFEQAQHWYSITYSFKTNIFLDTATKEEFLNRYKVADAFIRSLRSAGLIHGAVAVREISINSFQGKAVFPHTHVVVNSDRSDLINEDGTYHTAIAEEAARTGVSIKVTRITDSSVFLTQLKYPLKPINIKSLYEQEAVNYDYNEINLGLDTVLCRLTEYGKGTPRIVYYGNMDARCKDYMGEDMNQQKRAKRALAQAQVAPQQTKELNSASAPTKMVTVQLDPATTTIMPYAPQPVMPPQTQAPQKKKNFWGPLALGVGAGIAGLGAYDQFANHGRATSAVLNSLKRYFPSSAQSSVMPPPVARNPVPLGPARTEAAVIADMTAGRVGGHFNDAGRNALPDWLRLQRDVAKDTTFAGIPGHAVSTGPSPVARVASDPRLPRIFTSPEGQAAYRALSSQQPDTGAALGTSDLLSNVIPTGAAVADIGVFGVNASGGLSGLLSKILPKVGITSPKVLGPLSRISSFASRPIFGGPSAAGSITRATTPILGGAMGYSVGSNPLNVEAYMDAFKDLPPERAALASRLFGTLGGSAIARRSPFLGSSLVAGAAGLVGRASSQIEDMTGSVAERGAFGDVLNRLYRGARAGNPEYRIALENALKYVDSNPQLAGAIAGKEQPWYRSWPVTEQMGDSPALQSLINKSRQAILE